jgi:hypothetical protein
MGADTSSRSKFPEMEFLSELLPAEPLCMEVRELNTSDAVVVGTHIVCGAAVSRASTDGHFRVSTIAMDHDD